MTSAITVPFKRPFRRKEVQLVKLTQRHKLGQRGFPIALRFSGQTPAFYRCRDFLMLRFANDSQHCSWATFRADHYSPQWLALRDAAMITLLLLAVPELNGLEINYKSS